MGKIQRLSTEQRDELVAYLDGEMTDVESAGIEKILAESPIARHEVEMLSRTWDLLEWLPRKSASADFTRKTLTRMQAVNKAPPPISQQPWFIRAQRSVIAAIWAVGLAAVGFAGYNITQSLVPNETLELLDNFAIIRNLSEYQELGSVEFLTELQKSRLFDKPNSSEAEAGGDAGDSAVAPGPAVAPGDGKPADVRKNEKRESKPSP
jgi:hypothetical protein